MIQLNIHGYRVTFLTRTFNKHSDREFDKDKIILDVQINSFFSKFKILSHKSSNPNCFSRIFVQRFLQLTFQIKISKFKFLI